MAPVYQQVGKRESYLGHRCNKKEIGSRGLLRNFLCHFISWGSFGLMCSQQKKLPLCPNSNRSERSSRETCNSSKDDQCPGGNRNSNVYINDIKKRWRMSSYSCSSHHPNKDQWSHDVEVSVQKTKKIPAGSWRTNRRFLWRWDGIGATEPEPWSRKCLPRSPRQTSTSAGSGRRRLPALSTSCLNVFDPWHTFLNASVARRRGHGCPLMRSPPSGSLRTTWSTVRWPLTWCKTQKKFNFMLMGLSADERVWRFWLGGPSMLTRHVV